MARFVKTNKCECVDTLAIYAHTECFFKENDYLILETISGDKINLGEIKCSCDNCRCKSTEV